MATRPSATCRSFGSFLIMGLIGVIIASIINIFLGSSALQFAISIIGILVFVGLTAWDTQSIKLAYSEHHDAETHQKLAVMGALSLYLNFINLFPAAAEPDRPARGIGPRQGPHPWIRTTATPSRAVRQAGPGRTGPAPSRPPGRGPDRRPDGPQPPVPPITWPRP